MRNVSQIIDGKRKIIKKPELLAPAGNLEKLKVAVIYGADAVFVGGKEFSLRSQASNFTLEDIKEGVEFAKQYGAAIHVTCNIILHEDNLEGIEEYLKALDEIGVDAIIAADPHIILTAKRLINIDSEAEGVFTVGCAGGNRTQCVIPIKTSDFDGEYVTIRIEGLLGGHSGVEINKGRANANILLGRVLKRNFKCW